MKHLFSFICTMLCVGNLCAQQVTTFEMRHFNEDVKANGVTDFHGETEVFNTEQRVVALNKYADYASKFWGDRQLNTPLFSDDVDVVYGPQDEIRPVIFNLEDACKVNLTVVLQNANGKVVERKIFKDVSVEAGRSVTRLDGFRFRHKGEGCYFVVYKIQKSE